MSFNQSDAGILSPLLRDPKATAILLDVDGTLAPIVKDARDASVSVPVKTALVKLTRKYGLVACVSGRQAEDARRVVGAGGLTYIGGHGSELLRPGESEASVDATLEPWTEPVHDAAAEAIRELSGLGIRREDKGAVSALHWRGTPDEAASERSLQTIARRAEDNGLVAHWGKKVLEIRPPAPFDKGLGVRKLLSGSGMRNALYAGDDRTDLDAFNTLMELNLSGELDGIARVAAESPEAPHDLLAAADLKVSGTAGVEALITHLLQEPA